MDTLFNKRPVAHVEVDDQRVHQGQKQSLDDIHNQAAEEGETKGSEKKIDKIDSEMLSLI